MLMKVAYSCVTHDKMYKYARGENRFIHCIKKYSLGLSLFHRLGVSDAGGRNGDGGKGSKRRAEERPASFGARACVEGRVACPSVQQRAVECRRELLDWDVL